MQQKNVLQYRMHLRSKGTKIQYFLKKLSNDAKIKSLFAPPKEWAKSNFEKALLFFIADMDSSEKYLILIYYSHLAYSKWHDNR